MLNDFLESSDIDDDVVSRSAEGVATAATARATAAAPSMIYNVSGQIDAHEDAYGHQELFLKVISDASPKTT